MRVFLDVYGMLLAVDGDLAVDPLRNMVSGIPQFQAHPYYYSYGHLPVITGYKLDYTFYKWGYKYL